MAWEKAKLGGRLHFHDWEAVLRHSELPVHRKESWAITIRWYLSWARRARVPVDFDSARDFMAQVEVDKHPNSHRLEQWKEALRWFFREGRRREGASGVPTGPRESAALRGVGGFRQPITRPEPACDVRVSKADDDGGNPVHGKAGQGKAGSWRERAIETIRVRKYSYRTEQTYLEWLGRFARSVRGRDVKGCGATEVRAFLNDLAVRGQVSASTQRQALNALVFFYREVLGRDLGDFSDYRRASARANLRTSLTQSECARLLEAVEPSMQLLVRVLYGSGLRLMECLRLRVKDLDLERRTLMVRAGKGNKDRVTVLADCVIEPLQQHLKAIREVWEEDRKSGLAGVWLPEALSRKYPKAGESWEWFWVWPSREISVDPRGSPDQNIQHPASNNQHPMQVETARGDVRPTVRRRHHVLERRVQQVVQLAARKAGLNKQVTPHVLRHTFATLMLEGNRTDPRTLQELMGHKSLETTQGYLHVMNRPGLGIRSPLDG